MPLAVVGKCTSCMYSWLDIKFKIVELQLCKMFSLKSLRIIHGKLYAEKCSNILDSRLVNICNGTLGDRSIQ